MALELRQRQLAAPGPDGGTARWGDHDMAWDGPRRRCKGRVQLVRWGLRAMVHGVDLQRPIKVPVGVPSEPGDHYL
ncbi:hypothetical protein GCM10010191_95620 [Actinomadura vinacea]|uniref:Uncharacterized protein n=1 Tax=Actinomadura vinacea TaxID=115336 RepID=A0ABN3KHY4_9ACTN